MSEEVIKTTSGCDAMIGGLLGAMANRRENNDPMAMAAMMNGEWAVSGITPLCIWFG